MSPLHYNNKQYETFTGLVRAIQKNHPTWSPERCRRYAGGLRARQEGLGKHGKKR